MHFCKANEFNKYFTIFENDNSYIYGYGKILRSITHTSPYEADFLLKYGFRIWTKSGDKSGELVRGSLVSK